MAQVCRFQEAGPIRGWGIVSWHGVMPWARCKASQVLAVATLHLHVFTCSQCLVFLCMYHIFHILGSFTNACYCTFSLDVFIYLYYVHTNICVGHSWTMWYFFMVPFWTVEIRLGQVKAGLAHQSGRLQVGEHWIHAMGRVTMEELFLAWRFLRQLSCIGIRSWLPPNFLETSIESLSHDKRLEFCEVHLELRPLTTDAELQFSHVFAH